jgi:hypothetical protein
MHRVRRQKEGEVMKKILMTLLLLSVVLTLVGLASGDELKFQARLSGDNEVPPVDTDTTGKAKVEFNKDLTEAEFRLKVKDGDLVTRAHIHCAPAGQNGPIVVALLEHRDGEVSTVRLSEEVELEATITGASISNVTCGATLEELAQSMRDGNTYVNVHTVDNPAGVIRGQLKEKNDDDD